MTVHRADCPGGKLCTLTHGRDVIAARGWGVGTVLEGDEGHGPERIIIRYIGRDLLIAEADGGREGTWTLGFRCWGEAAR